MVIELSQSDLDYIQSVYDSGQDLYRAYDRISESIGYRAVPIGPGPQPEFLSPSQTFWFEQAAKRLQINW